MTTTIASARLIDRRDLSPTLALFRLRPDAGPLAFEAGQFITLGLRDEATGETTWRAYSIASRPGERHVELLIRHVMEPEPGSFTTLLWELPVGATIRHRGVAGAFTVPADERLLLCVGGGTGVSPFVSMALDLAARDVPREMVIVHGASVVGDLAFDEPLRRLEAETAPRGDGHFRLRYVPTISRPADPANAGWAGQTGRAETVLDRIPGLELDPTRVFAMACGYDGTVNGVVATLETRGFVTRRSKRVDGSYDIKFESYG